jgi:hypothetical protein
MFVEIIEINLQFNRLSQDNRGIKDFLIPSIPTLSHGKQFNGSFMR